MTKWTVSETRALRWLRHCVTVGTQPQLAGKPTLHCDGRVHIGNHFRLASRPVASHMVAGPDATLTIGNDVSIGHGAAIAAFQHVRIGNGTRIGPFVIIMDTNFHGDSGGQAVQHDCRPVVIGDGCRIGSRVTITRGATIGDGAEILAGSIVTSSVPAGACAAGGRARVIGQAGHLASRWESPAAALPELLMTALGLRSPPDLDDNPMPGGAWTDDGISRLQQVLAQHIGVALTPTAIREAGTFAALAAIIQAARDGRPQD